MEYAQRNPLPVPPGGAYEPIKATIDSVFDWQYALRQANLLNLYEKGKTLAWNANDLDWSTDVDIERLVRQRVANGLAPMINAMLSPPVHLGDDEVIRMQLHLNAFMLSQFLHGEQGALLATAKIVQGVPWAEAKFYAANQVADEARHVEVYHRYLTEKLGISYEVVPSLNRLLDDIILDAPTVFNTASGPYAPHNYDGRFEGNITLRRAIAQSDSRHPKASFSSPGW